eukprot:TRINITY_DN5475_c0_g1_i1.p1 TRINITY_DN5475_c0_g1~~TRINITY_DN5475_c0_g1_i1.p1  ORF type:complete len:861 (+),score=236.49 TRINITY_DN5475_c0_g1_i1:84-2666(+)
MLLFRWGVLLSHPGSPPHGPIRCRLRHLIACAALSVLLLIAVQQFPGDGVPAADPAVSEAERRGPAPRPRADAAGARGAARGELLAIVFASSDCSGSARLELRQGAREGQCADCLDLCGKRFADGTSAHGKTGGRARSLRVAPGWRVEGTATCLGEFPITAAGERAEDSVGTWTAADGCVAVDNQLAHLLLQGRHDQPARRAAAETVVAPGGGAAAAAAVGGAATAAVAAGGAAKGRSKWEIQLELDPYPGPPAGIAATSVELYAERGCSGAKLTVKATNFEPHCARCFDVCGKKFESGAVVHSGQGSHVRSLRVLGPGYAEPYRSCLGTYPRGSGAVGDLRAHDAWSAKDGCVSDAGSWDHLMFSSDDANQTWWRPSDFVYDDGSPLLAYGPLPKPQRPKPNPTPWQKPPPELPFFDMTKTEEERSAALSQAVADLRAVRPRDEATAQELGLLLMLQRKWAEAHDVLREAAEKPGSDRRTKTFLGHAIEGMRALGLSTVSEKDLAKTYFDARPEGSSEYGSDSDVVDTHYAPYAGLCCGYSGRHTTREQWYNQVASETVADAIAYFEMLRLRHGWAVPQLRAMGASRGPEDWQAADTIEETAERFARADIAVVKEAIPPFVASRVQRFYRAAIGVCRRGDRNGPVCDPPRSRIFPPNAVDPFVQNAHSDRVGFWINQYLRPLAESYAGRPLNPMYSYMVRYYGKPKNHGLEPHLDMVDNEYTMSISVDHFALGECPLFALKKRTPFHEEASGFHYPRYKQGWPHMYPGDAIGGNLSFGDAILFRGRQHGHYRPPFILGSICHATISHFVDRDYTAGRALHNQEVCCQWPPLAKHNREICPCSDPRRAEEKRRKMQQQPL